MDPLLVKWVSVFFAGLLVLAARHKLASLPSFRAVLGEYRLLPGSLVGPAASAIPAAELVLALAWIASLAGVLPAAAAAAGTATLISAYTLAILANLLRGRRHISCGCGLTANEGEFLGPGLVLRNALLVVFASIPALPAAERALGPGGYGVLAAALLASMLLYLAGSQLLRNAGAMGAWRRGDD